VTPLYGFLEGDSIGLLVLAAPTDTMAQIAAKLQQSASVRVAPRARVHVEIGGRPVSGTVTVQGVGLAALDRFDVRVDEEST
jgi:hypothetical protein